MSLISLTSWRSGVIIYLLFLTEDRCRTNSLTKSGIAVSLSIKKSFYCMAVFDEDIILDQKRRMANHTRPFKSPCLDIMAGFIQNKDPVDLHGPCLLQPELWFDAIETCQVCDISKRNSPGSHKRLPARKFYGHTSCASGAHGQMGQQQQE